MATYFDDANTLSLQSAAFDAAADESAVLDRYLAGCASEAEYLSAMEATAAAVQYAVANGVSFKDLPCG